MPDGDNQRFDALTEAIVRLLKRVDELERKVARIEGVPVMEVSVEPAPPPQIPANPPPLPEPPPIAVAPQPRAKPEIHFEIPNPTAPHLETRVGLTWVNRIGVVTLIIGVAFFFKYAIDNQWIGETGRVILGVLAGLATVAAGDILWRRGQKIFAQGICGLGVSILYLSFYASFSFYHLLPQAAAFVLMVMVTAMAGALALRYDAIAIAALGMLGGYSTPILLSGHQDAPWTFFGYVFLIDAGGIAIARLRRWRPLDLMAFLATVLLYASWFGKWFVTANQIVATVAALAFYALFAMVEWSWIFYAIQVLAGVALTVIWPDAMHFMVLSLVVGAAGLVIADHTRRPLAASVSFATFWAAYGGWQAFNGKKEDTIAIFALLTVAFVMYQVWTPFEKLVRRVEIRAPHLVVLALNGAVYFAFSYYLLNPDYHAWMGLLSAAVAGLYLLLGMQFWKEQVSEGRDLRPALLTLGVALGFLTLAVPVQFTGFSITLSWAIEAAALVWIGRKTNENRVLLGAAAIYMFVFFRLYAFDAWLPPAHALLANLRFVTFVVAAVSFWLGAWFLKATRRAAAVAYIAGHVIMLSACLFEMNDWIGTMKMESQTSLLAIGASILMALYAVLLVVIGVSYRSVLDRILGLGLIGLVVVKLYLYDVWEAGRLFRMAAFIALGVLLLLTSYLYSRFRPMIENWWKDEKSPQ